MTLPDINSGIFITPKSVEVQAFANCLGTSLESTIKEVIRVMDRYSSFAFQSSQKTTNKMAVASAVDVRDFILRILQRVGDPINYSILNKLVDCQSSIEELMELVSLERLSVWERINDLLQMGLVSRSLEMNLITLTQSGHLFVQLVEFTIESTGVENELPLV